MIIGLTGGIASGKSTAAGILATLGAHVIDADKLGHQAYEPGNPAYHDVVKTFGKEIVAADGSIDRKALGSKVFGDPDGLKKLTDIVWPEILRLAKEQIDEVLTRAPATIVVLEAAVLLEAGWDAHVDAVWCTVVPPDIAVSRACARDGLDAQAVRKRIESQISNEERMSRADVILHNAAEPDAFSEAVVSAWNRLQEQQV